MSPPAALLRARLHALRHAPAEALAEARGRLFGFVPVALALGIAGYFSLPAEPGATVWAALAALCAAALAVWLRGPEAAQPLAALFCLALIGAGLAGLRTQMVAAPVLGWHYYGAIEGRVIAIDRSHSDAPRLTLDDVVLERLPPHRTPARVRVALHGEQGFLDPEAGQRVMLTGHLSPPSGPAEPGGFDFARLAYFQKIGAVGYTRTPLLLVEPAQAAGLGQAVTRLRLRISAAVQTAVPGEGGGFAAAILTGDRTGVGRETLEDLRASNLAHLLAISGLHMGLLTAIVFGAVRTGLALVPPLALRLPTRKVAAVVALGAGAFYLALSGGNVATQRAFVMVAVMLVAVLADRRALSLRSVAMAATLILVLRPEALLEAGFQMSFAATVALVAVFGALRDWRVAAGADRPRVPGWVAAPMGVVICSTVAGFATAPVAAAAFNRVAEYGLVANLLAVPLMGSVVMPAAVAAGVLAPFGLAGPALWVMELGTRWILGVAAFVGGLEGAVMPVVQPPGWVLPVMALGALWLVLWPGRTRWAGPAVMALALAGWPGAARPPVLVAGSGTLIGVMGPEGRVLSKASGERFVSESWLQADGDGADPEQAAARPGVARGEGVLLFDLAGRQGVHLTGRGAADRVAEWCRGGALVILGNDAPEGVTGDCLLIDKPALRRSGALALWPTAEGVRIVSARERVGERPWLWR
ncbi:MAG: ComEC/Rec2 family competence protein [Alkalilacustris sp.]